MILDAAAGMPSQLVKEPSGREPFAIGYDFDGDDWIADVPVGAGVSLRKGEVRRAAWGGFAGATALRRSAAARSSSVRRRR